MAINSSGEFTLGPVDRKEPLVVPPDFIKNLSMDTKVIAPSTSDNSGGYMVAAKDIFEYLDKYQTLHGQHPAPCDVWNAATKAAEEKFTSDNSAMDAMQRIVSARNCNAEILPFFAAIVDIVDEYAAQHQ